MVPEQIIYVVQLSRILKRCLAFFFLLDSLMMNGLHTELRIGVK